MSTATKSSVNRSLWIKAAAIGSIWAAFEIILGGFLHALRLPFAGTTLTFFSVALLTAFARRYPVKGLFWRTAVVAALLRSLMPTTVIFGPLIAIVLEGLFFEWAVRLGGFRRASFALAGVLAMFSAVIHKAVSLVIIYGWDIVRILENLYHVFLHATGWHLPARELFLWVALVYLLAGMAAAWTGDRLASRIWNRTAPLHTWEWTGKRSGMLSVPPGFRFHPLEAGIHPVALVFFLAALEFLPFAYVFPLAVGYEIWLIRRYGQGLRKLNKPFFWIQILIVAALALWLWDDKRQGLTVAAKLITRAVLLVSVFTAIGMELRNPLVERLARRRGWSGLYDALQSATAVLPSVLAYLGKERSQWKHPVRLLRQTLLVSEQIIDRLEKKDDRPAPVYLVTGVSGSGKTTRMRAFLEKLQTENPPDTILGFLTPAVYENGEHTGYDLICLHSGQRFSWARKKPVFDKPIPVGRFYLDAAVADRCLPEILARLPGARWLLLDEVGPLECRGEVWRPLLDKINDYPQLRPVIAVRPPLRECLETLLPGRETVILE